MPRLPAAPSPLTPESFQAEVGVSRETLARLGALLDALRKWQRSINLVAASTLADPWRRHILDSAQLAPFIAPGARAIDLGSGAGFPGLVLAIVRPDLEVVEIESDRRKCEFMREARRHCRISAEIVASRIEDSTVPPGDVVVARGLAPLAKLLEYAEPHLRPGGRCLFLKGERADDEIAVAAGRWHMAVERHPSRSDPRGTIVDIKEFARV